MPRALSSASTNRRRSTRRGDRPWRRSLVERLKPTWGATHLGQALIDAAGAIENVGDAASRSSSVRRRIVLISDLQQGSRLDALGDFEWPSDLELELKAVATEGSNAGLQWLAGQDTGEPAAEGANDLRVRVSNDATSKKESFGLAWTDDKTPPIPAYVPPGESRVVRLPRPAGSAPRRMLRLQGDTQEFDNLLYLASESKESATVLYVGRDAADDPSGLSYYLKRVFEDMPRRTVKVESRAPAASLSIEPGLVVPLDRAVGRDLGRERRVSQAIREGRRDRTDRCHGAGQGADPLGSCGRPGPGRGGLALPG